MTKLIFKRFLQKLIVPSLFLLYGIVSVIIGLSVDEWFRSGDNSPPIGFLVSLFLIMIGIITGVLFHLTVSEVKDEIELEERLNKMQTESKNRARGWRSKSNA